MSPVTEGHFQVPDAYGPSLGSFGESPPPPSPGHNPGLSALDYELSDQSLVS